MCVLEQRQQINIPTTQLARMIPMQLQVSTVKDGTREVTVSSHDHQVGVFFGSRILCGLPIITCDWSTRTSNPPTAIPMEPWSSTWTTTKTTSCLQPWAASTPFSRSSLRPNPNPRSSKSSSPSFCPSSHSPSKRTAWSCSTTV